MQAMLMGKSVGGFELETRSGEPRYRRRRVRVVQAGAPKEYDLEVSSPSRPPGAR